LIKFVKDRSRYVNVN